MRFPNTDLRILLSFSFHKLIVIFLSSVLIFFKGLTSVSVGLSAGATAHTRSSEDDSQEFALSTLVEAVYIVDVAAVLCTPG